jgi:hypothetical protein
MPGKMGIFHDQMRTGKIVRRERGEWPHASGLARELNVSRRPASCCLSPPSLALIQFQSQFQFEFRCGAREPRALTPHRRLAN